MDTENDKLIPLEDSVIYSNVSDIDKKLLKVPKKKCSKDEIAAKPTKIFQVNSNKDMWTFFTNTKRPSAQTNMTKFLQPIKSTKYTSKQ